MDPAAKLFSAGPVELWQVNGPSRTKLQEGAPLEVFSAAATKQHPALSALLQVGSSQWLLSSSSHTMRSLSDASEPTFIFSGVLQGDSDTFYCVIFRRSECTLL
eukprot:GHRQ01022930.1.p2 GENE.GHRQ01022930.1~~GHRQ01022930.1.p2  ORF type:complete len:104 (+),score=54.16 GHRQ01022930.1:494-805(+)